MQHVLFNFLPYFLLILFTSCHDHLQPRLNRCSFGTQPTKNKFKKKYIFVKVCKKEKGSYDYFCCTSQNEMARGGHASKKAVGRQVDFLPEVIF